LRRLGSREEEKQKRQKDLPFMMKKKEKTKELSKMQLIHRKEGK